MDSLSVSVLSVFTVALLHVLIPSHWLCFVVVGRAQGWSARRTLAVAASAGALHVASTVALGVAVGASSRQLLEEEILERAGGFILIGLGVLYLASHLLHAGHRHEQDRQVGGKTAFLALVLSLALSPCSAAIPLVVATWGRLAWIPLLLITGALLATTVGGMLILVGLTHLGIEKLRLAFFDRYEKMIVGLALCALGSAGLLVHHH